MTLSNCSRLGAFGVLNRPIQSISGEIDGALLRAHTGLRRDGYKPMDRLRRRIATAMSCDVVFYPKGNWVYENTRYPNSRVPVRRVWKVTPVWLTAPKVAVYKANRLASLLNGIALFGYKANIVHDLVRMAINIWSMSRRDFDGLCRRITSRLVNASREEAKSRKSPDPLMPFVRLMSNPVHFTNRENWFTRNQKVRGWRLGRVGLRRLPIHLGLVAELLSTRWYKTHVRRMVYTTPI